MNLYFTQWSKQCQHHCLHLPHIVITSTTVKGLNLHVSTKITEVYQKFKVGLTKKPRAKVYHHPEHMTLIYLLTGTAHTTIFNYYLFQQGYINSSTSPTSAGFSFVEKKGVVSLTLYWLQSFKLNYSEISQFAPSGLLSLITTLLS